MLFFFINIGIYLIINLLIVFILNTLGDDNYIIVLNCLFINKEVRDMYFLHTGYSLTNYKSYIKILPKQINKNKYDSSLNKFTTKLMMNPWFLTGFSDAESSWAQVIVEKCNQGDVARSHLSANRPYPLLPAPPLGIPPHLPSSHRLLAHLKILIRFRWDPWSGR